MALHAATLAHAGDEGWPGDAKVAGVIEEHPDRLDPQHPDAAQLSIDVQEAVFTRVDDGTGRLRIERWRAADEGG